MPRRDDLRKILVPGPDPVASGEDHRLDCSAAQACRTLMADGYQVVFVSPSPAGVTADPDLATRTYVEALGAGTLARIIEVERPDALLPTVGGRAALSLAAELQERGVLDLFGVEMLGVSAEVLRRFEDRDRLDAAVKPLGLRVSRSGSAQSAAEAEALAAALGWPLAVRPAPAGVCRVAADAASLRRLVARALELSSTGEVLLEESPAGRHEYEFVVVRDAVDNVIAVCSIEHVEPQGSRWNDGVCVAPALTLTGHQYRNMREAAVAVVRAAGLHGGSATVRFGADPESGETVVASVDPRLTRSSALVSKATGVPIAGIAARLAVGYALDEISNGIAGSISACFEPAPDYVVVSMPCPMHGRSQSADIEPPAHGGSAGRVMAVGRTFKEAFLKGLRSRESGTAPALPAVAADTLTALASPAAEQCELILHAFRQGISPEEVHERTSISRFFLAEFGDIIELEREVSQSSHLDADQLRRMKRYGFSDERLAALSRRTPREVRALRLEHDVAPVFKGIDTCAAEFPAAASCFYSTYEEESEARPGERERILILGGGRDGDGRVAEADYCCVHAAMAAREMGYETVMVNCDPDAMSTDRPVCDRLYLEPLTFEDVMNVVANERPQGVIAHFGGPTSVRLAAELTAAGVNVLGAPQEPTDPTEERRRLGALLSGLGIPRPSYGVAHDGGEAREIAARLGFPLLVRAADARHDHAGQVVHDEPGLSGRLASWGGVGREGPLLLEEFFDDAVRVTVDALTDGEQTFVAAVIEHLDEACVRSGEASWVIPPVSPGEAIMKEMGRQTGEVAPALGARGLLQAQFAVRDRRVCLLDVRAGAARTVPFADKATGLQLARLATHILLGERLSDLGLPSRLAPRHVSVRRPVPPRGRLSLLEPGLAPGATPAAEVMGIAATLPVAFTKAQAAAHTSLPSGGTVLLSVADRDHAAAAILGQRLVELGFDLVATDGTAGALVGMGVKSACVSESDEGGDLLVKWIDEGKIALVIATPSQTDAGVVARKVREAARGRGVPCLTTLVSAAAAVSAMEAAARPGASLVCLQDLHAEER